MFDIYSYMNKKETKYRERALKYQKAYRDREKQKKQDEKIAKLLKELYNMDGKDLELKWPVTKKILRK